MILLGIMKIITSVHEGLHNAPRLYGSDVREPERVSDFSSGVKAGGRVRPGTIAVSPSHSKTGLVSWLLGWDYRPCDGASGRRKKRRLRLFLTAQY